MPRFGLSAASGCATTSPSFRPYKHLLLEGGSIMPQFLVYHTLPAGLGFDQVQQMAKGTQGHANVNGCHSYLNLTKGKGVCTWEGPTADAVAARLNELQIPFDEIIDVEVEGKRGDMHRVGAAAAAR
jgi:hypothetical protein